MAETPLSQYALSHFPGGTDCLLQLPMEKPKLSKVVRTGREYQEFLHDLSSALWFKSSKKINKTNFLTPVLILKFK